MARGDGEEKISGKEGGNHGKGQEGERMHGQPESLTGENVIMADEA